MFSKQTGLEGLPDYTSLSRLVYTWMEDALASIDPAQPVLYNSPVLESGRMSSLFPMSETKITMTQMNSDTTVEDLLRHLTARAQALWGEDKASAMSSALEQTARPLWQIGQTTPARDVAPGFYQ